MYGPLQLRFADVVALHEFFVMLLGKVVEGSFQDRYGQFDLRRCFFPLQLQEQAFAQRPCTHPGRVQLLHFFQYIADGGLICKDILGKSQIVHDLGYRTADIPALIHTAYQEFGYLPFLVIQVFRIELAQQVLVEGNPGCIWDLFFFFIPIIAASSAVVGDFIIAQVIVNIDVFCIDDIRVRLCFEGILELRISLLRFCPSGLQGGVLLQLLLQPLFKCLRGQLYQFHQLNLLRGQFLGKFELQVLFEHIGYICGLPPPSNLRNSL